ncbi:MAG: fumarylacetoacetate hydrolase family protein, partial [Pirellula sp.]
SVIGHGDTVRPPRSTKELDFELEIALMVGKEAIDLPADDSALECICAMTIYNDWSARDLQRQEMAVGLGPAKGKDFANAFGPRWVPIHDLMSLIAMVVSIWRCERRSMARRFRVGMLGRCIGLGHRSLPMQAVTPSSCLAM